MSDSLIKEDLHESDKTTTKIWRFNANLAKVYTVKRVEDEIVQLFPHLIAKNLGVKLYHVDELAGRVEIDGDADLTEALNNVNSLHN